jgi:peptidoglycan/LPS O-acetylase OafA/YrhL
VAVFLEHMLITNNAAIKSSQPFIFFESHFHLASLGVGFFIVLSGFLITWIILEEYKFRSSFNLSFFWFRRCLRIWPLYFLIIITGFLLVAIAQQSNATVHNMPSFIWLITFTLNFYIINHGEAFLFFIVFLWSISVEEQLYVVWGLFLKYIKPLFVPFCLLLIVASIVFRVHFSGQSLHLYFSTINWLPHFALGSLIAYLGINGGKLFEKLKNIPHLLIIAVYFLFILNLLFYNYIYASYVMTILQRFIDALFFAFFIFEQNFCTNRFINPGKSKKLSYLGKISYGLFCYHGLVILLFTQAVQQIGWLNNSLFVFFINPVLTFVITIVVAAMSYKYFEKPIMSLRDKFKTA